MKEGETVYEGNFKLGSKTGKGKLFDKEGVLKYEGNFKQDFKHGFAK